MYRVLVPVDTSEERALSQVEHVVSIPNSDSSVEVLLQFVFQGEQAEIPETIRQYSSVERVSSVRLAKEHLEDHNVDVRVIEGSGDTAEDIIDRAETHDVDVIVMGGRERSPAAKAIFGSVTQSVFLNTDIPVTITGGKADPSPPSFGE